MGDYYRHFLSSMSGTGDHPPTSPDELQQPPYSGVPLPVSSGGMQMPYQSLGYFAGFPEPVMFNTAKPTKGRRKASAALGTDAEHVKHRRTRSGCFMCRSRRVKCDEARPICERCKKGNRECIYPDPPSAKGATTPGSRTKEGTSSGRQTSPMSSNEDDEEGGREPKLETIHDDEELDEQLWNNTSTQIIQGASMTPPSASRRGGSRDSEKGSSPSASTVTSGSVSIAVQPQSGFASPAEGRADWSHLPWEFQRHLNWFIDNVTQFHYSVPYVGDDFVRTVLPSVAIHHEPLLHALVGFAAYLATLQNPEGRLEDFLQFYNKSVTLLLKSLKRKEKYHVSTLLTILQLATIEEYLGDWVNLMGHQKAALEIITKIYDPETVMQTPTGRLCLEWYTRFDNFVALMGGFPTDLPRDWFDARTRHYESQVFNEPESLKWKIAERSTRLYLITYDMSVLFAKGSRGQISREDFAREHDNISRKMLEWKETWDPALLDTQYLVKDFSYQRPLASDDIVNPYAPGILYDWPLFTSTIINAEWHSIMILHKSQSTGLPPEQLFAELRTHAFATCQYFETVELWPNKPKGAIIMMQVCIAIAALFLPQDRRHQMWLRRKFALLETQGYIHPLSLRSKMAEIFQEPSCVHWWLPNDEGFSTILKSVRDFADERNAAAVTAQQENLREVRHIFAKLALAQ